MFLKHCFAAALVLFAAATLTSADEPLKIETVLQRWQARQDTLTSAEISWTAEVAEATFSNDPKIPPVVRSTHERRLRFHGDHFHYESKGPKWDNFLNALRPQEMVLFLTPKQSKRFFPKAETGKLLDGAYVVTSVWPMGHLSDNGKGLEPLTIYELRPLTMWARPLALPHQDFGKGEWKFSEEKKLIAGNACILAMRYKPENKKTERFWLCKELDYLPLKVEFQQEESTTFSYEVKLDAKTKNIAGWDEFQNSTTGTFLNSCSVTIHDLKLNSISLKTDIDFEFPPGTHVTDDEKQTGFTVPDKKESAIKSPPDTNK